MHRVNPPPPRLTEIRFMSETDFYIPQGDLGPNQSLSLQLKFMDKEGNVRIEEGEIQQSTIS